MDRHTHTKKPTSDEDSNPDSKIKRLLPAYTHLDPHLPTCTNRGLDGTYARKGGRLVQCYPNSHRPPPRGWCSGPSSPPRPRLRPPPKRPSSVPPRPRNGLTQRPPKTAGWEEPKRWDGGAQCSRSSSCKKCTHPDITNAIARVVEGCQTGRLSLVAARITSTTRLPSPKARNEVLPPRGLK